MLTASVGLLSNVTITVFTRLNRLLDRACRVRGCDRSSCQFILQIIVPTLFFSLKLRSICGWNRYRLNRCCFSERLLLFLVLSLHSRTEFVLRVRFL